MTRFFLIFLLANFFLFSTSSAAIYKGQRAFVKKCVKCHEAGQGFIAEYKMKEWKKWMKKKGKKLAEVHLESKKAKKSHKYFKSRSYKKASKHLKQFVVEYAKDSGNVPACN